jgi:hypothetical protein
MVLNIHFVMDNDAFGDTGEDIAKEMNRILKDLSGRYKTVDIKNGEHLNIKDINGNSIGSLNIVPD